MATTVRPAEERDTSARSWATLWRYARPHRAILGLTLVLTLLTSAAGLLQPLAARHALDALAAGEGLGPVLALMVLLMGTSAVVSGWTVWLQRRTAERIVRQVRRSLAGRLLRLRVAELDRTAPADLVSRVTADSALLQNAASQGFVMVVTGALTLLGACVLMLVIQPVLFAATATALAGVAIALRWVMPRIRRAVTETQTAVGELGSRLDRSVGALRTVKSNAAEDREATLADETIERAYRSGLGAARYHAAAGIIGTSGMQGAFLTVLGAGGVLVARNSIDVSSLIAFLLYVFYLAAPLAALSGGLAHLQQGLGATVRIREIETMDVEDDAGRPAVVTAPARPPAVEIREVSFAYRGRPPALRQVSFRAAPGTRTALVGLSGAGKSTLFALMQRFYEPAQGVIELGGRDIATMSRAQVRAAMAYVEQDAAVLSGTIRDNLLYGRPRASAGEIAAALRDSGLAELVDRLDQGLETRVGPRGVLLSGGERQRLAIARALLRRPSVLLLDEVTASLDARNEQALRGVIDRVAPACTVLLIAHRLSTVTSADQIVVLDRGVVRATGTHAALLKSDALYSELVSTQLLAEPGPGVATGVT
ncbi:ABC transporter ATP-binding protein [Actinoplanes sp. RD1]|uniref:ABC transporter ATP-binding protein n=1 Tax=Actinoplanes sp. RD1 TaxID=3064538 RepID=UPI002741EF2E|nr:ABC transporter ATP-binding protein [Actinoplanes sp. RD1]